MIAAMRTVFFRIFVCYVGPAYIACSHFVEAGGVLGADWFDCWHAHPIQRPSAFQVCHLDTQVYIASTDAAQKNRQRGRITFRSCV